MVLGPFVLVFVAAATAIDVNAAASDGWTPLHYAAMKANPKQVINDIAEFIGVEADPKLVDAVAQKT